MANKRSSRGHQISSAIPPATEVFGRAGQRQELASRAEVFHLGARPDIHSLAAGLAANSAGR